MAGQCFKIEPEYIREEINYFSIVNKTNSQTNFVMLGPLAYVNHKCQPNAEFWSKTKTLICVKTISSINAGNEILVNYGNHYFGPDNISCLCACCITKKNKTRYKQ